MTDQRMFPMQTGPDIPWEMIEPFEHQARRNHSQTLQRLAERSGLFAAEAIAVLTGRSWMDFGGMKEVDAIEQLVAMVEKWQEKQENRVLVPLKRDAGG